MGPILNESANVGRESVTTDHQGACATLPVLDMILTLHGVSIGEGNT